MNKVRLPLANTPSAQSGATQTAQVSSLATYPPTLGTKPVPEKMPGTVKGQTPQGQLIVQTQLGELTINSNIKLPPGLEIIIQFRTNRPPFEVLLVPQRNQAKSQTPISPHTPTDKLSLGQTLQATLVSKAAANPSLPLPQTISSLPTGASFPVRVEISTIPVQTAGAHQQPSDTRSNPQQTQSLPPTSQPSPQPTSHPQQTNVRTQPQAQIQVPQTQVPQTQTPQTQVPQSQAPQSQATQTQATQTQNILNAVVTGENKGSPILQTQFGNIQLAIKAPLALGTKITLTLLPNAGDEITVGSGDNALRPLSKGQASSRQDIRVLLQSALGTLNHIGQGNALTSHFPNQGPTLSAGILLFLNALKAGTPKSWAGEDTLSLLRAAGRPDLAQQLSSETTQFTRPVETAQGEWRMTQLPILHEGVLQKVNLFVRDRENKHQGEDTPESEKSTRFKLEVEMSRDGDIQFDGLVKKRRFDLVVRSRSYLPDPMQTKISELFYGANDVTGFAGRVKFEVSNDWEKLSASSDKLLAMAHKSTLA